MYIAIKLLAVCVLGPPWGLQDGHARTTSPGWEASWQTGQTISPMALLNMEGPAALLRAPFGCLSSAATQWRTLKDPWTCHLLLWVIIHCSPWIDWWNESLAFWFSPHICSDPSIKLPIHSSLTWTHPHVVVTPLGSGVGTHPFLVECQCVWASSPFWRFKDELFLGYHTNVNCCRRGLHCFTILLPSLTSIPDGGCAGPQHVSRPRDTRPRKKKRLRFQVNTIINLFIMESDLSIPFILLRNSPLAACHSWKIITYSKRD